MTYLRHVEACNRFDPDRFAPFFLEGRRIGFIRRDRIPVLAGFPKFFEIAANGIALSPMLSDRASRTAALDEVSDALIGDGHAPKWRHEYFAISHEWGGEVLFELDRGVIPFFGTRSYGVHLNGWRSGADGVELWIGKRAMDKKIAPGQLDNIVAGGISSGYGARETLLKEAAEEADMAPELAEKARAVGAVRYRMELPQGMRDDVLFLYDVEVPADWEPRNTDGEIEDFRVMAARDCLDLVHKAPMDSFKFNVNLVLIDFAIRHGLLTPEDPEYLGLIQGLSGGLIAGPV
jgi:hypothetical protein